MRRKELHLERNGSLLVCVYIYIQDCHFTEMNESIKLIFHGNE